MQVTLIGTALVAVLGNTVGVSWLAQWSPTASEPVRLALWGLTLLVVSNTLASRFRSRRQQRSIESRQTLGTSLARPA